MQSWLRQRGESSQAYEAFTAYLKLGSGRSIRAAYAAAKGLQKGIRTAPPGRWTAWSRRHRWAARAAAYDARNAEVIDDARSRVMREMAEKWQRRREAQREKDYAIGVQLQERASALLEQPLEARAGDVPRLAETGSKLARLAAGMETDHQKVTGSISVDIDLSALSDEQLREHMATHARAAHALIAGAPGAAAEQGV